MGFSGSQFHQGPGPLYINDPLKPFPPPVVYWNTEQTATNTCPGGTTGDPIVVTVPAGAFSSTLSQEEADAKALAVAVAQADALREETPCVPIGTWYNTEQTATNTCPGGDSTPSPITWVGANDYLNDGTYEGFGNFEVTSIPATPIDVTIPAGVYSSDVSQADANAIALAAATFEAAILRAASPCTFTVKFLGGTWVKSDSSTGSLVAMNLNGPMVANINVGETSPPLIAGEYGGGFLFYLFGYRYGFTGTFNPFHLGTL